MRSLPYVGLVALVLSLAGGLAFSQGLRQMENPYERQGSILVSSDWILIDEENGALAGDYFVFRRYAVVPNIGVSGDGTVTDLRNIKSMYCSTNPEKASYLLVFVPRDIDLPTIVGNDYFLYKEWKTEFNALGIAQAYGEVQANQLFFDRELNNRLFFEYLSQNRSFVLNFNERFSLLLVLDTDPLPREDNPPASELDVIDTVLQFTKLSEASVRRVSSSELVSNCR